MSFATKVRVFASCFFLRLLLGLAAVSPAPTSAAPPASESCATLLSLSLPNTTVTKATLIAAGDFSLLPDEHSAGFGESRI